MYLCKGHHSRYVLSLQDEVVFKLTLATTYCNKAAHLIYDLHRSLDFAIIAVGNHVVFAVQDIQQAITTALHLLKATFDTEAIANITSTIALSHQPGLTYNPATNVAASSSSAAPTSIDATIATSSSADPGGSSSSSSVITCNKVMQANYDMAKREILQEQDERMDQAKMLHTRLKVRMASGCMMHFLHPNVH
jgi:hypothetical protein